MRKKPLLCASTLLIGARRTTVRISIAFRPPQVGLAAAAAAATSVLTSPAGAAASLAPDVPTVYASGTATAGGAAAPGAVVLAELWPDAATLAAIPQGGTVPMWTLGRDTADATGTFSISLPVSSVPAQFKEADGRVDVTLTSISGTKSVTWNYSQEPVTAAGPVTGAAVADGSAAAGTAIRLDFGTGATFDKANDPAAWLDSNDRALGTPGRTSTSAQVGTATPDVIASVHQDVNAARDAAMAKVTGRTGSPRAAAEALAPVPCVTTKGGLRTGVSERFQSIYNWSGAAATAKQSYGVNHTLGIGVRFTYKSSSWSQDGAKTIDLNASATMSGLVNKNLYNKVNYRAYRRVCPIQGVTDFRRPESVNALLSKFTPSVNQTWNSACTSYGPGATLTKVKGKAYTKSTGVDLTFVKLSAQSGYSGSSEVIYKISKKSSACANSKVGWASARAMLVKSR